MPYESFCTHNICTIAIPIILRQPRIIKSPMKNIHEIDALYDGVQNGSALNRTQRRIFYAEYSSATGETSNTPLDLTRHNSDSDTTRNRWRGWG